MKIHGWDIAGSIAMLTMILLLPVSYIIAVALSNNYFMIMVYSFLSMFILLILVDKIWLPFVNYIVPKLPFVTGLDNTEIDPILPKI